MTITPEQNKAAMQKWRENNPALYEEARERQRRNAQRRRNRLAGKMRREMIYNTQARRAHRPVLVLDMEQNLADMLSMAEWNAYHSTYLQMYNVCVVIDGRVVCNRTEYTPEECARFVGVALPEVVQDCLI